MNQIAKDKLGQEIKVGDYVVLRLSGRSGDLHYGKVRKIEEDQSSGKPKFIIFVRQVIDYSWSPSRTLARKDSRLTNTNGMVIYPVMPQEVIDLFQEAGL